MYRNTKLAVVEAKAWDEALTEGVTQAKNYAGKLSIRYTYSTNGQGIYGIDMLTGVEGELAQYPTPDELWNRTFPDTRKALLAGLAEKGFSKGHLAEMQQIMEAQNSDLFDVLAYVAFALQPVTREERAATAKIVIHAHFNDKQQAFLDFVLAQYVKEGVDELDQEKLSPLLKLKYKNAIADAMADLGDPEQIRNAFVGFQKYLYQNVL